MNDIRTDNLTKVFKDKKAVDGLCLHIAEGELFALLGMNGAGKTTTIKMLCCLLKPSSGDAVLGGSSVVSDKAGVKKIINISPQQTAVAGNLSARENLELAAGIYGCSRPEARQKADDMIGRFQLQNETKTRAKRLSGGMQRRLSIAMALISQPGILFLDEPTLGLDVIARRQLWQAIEGLKGQVTIVLTTHYLEEAEALADRIGIMGGGRLLSVGTAKQLMDEAGTDNFEEAFIRLAGGLEAV